MSPDSGRLSLCGAKVASGSLVTPLERKLLGSGVGYPFLKQSLWSEGVKMASAGPGLGAHLELGQEPASVM